MGGWGKGRQAEYWLNDIAEEEKRLSNGCMGWTPIYPQMTEKEVQEEIDALRKAGAKMRRSKGGARAFMIKHGFITKDGKLTKQYGG